MGESYSFLQTKLRYNGTDQSYKLEKERNAEIKIIPVNERFMELNAEEEEWFQKVTYPRERCSSSTHIAFADISLKSNDLVGI